MIFGAIPWAMLPESFLSFGVLATVLTGAFSKQKNIVWLQAIMILFACLIALWLVAPSDTVVYHQAWLYDHTARLLKTGALVAVLAVLLYGQSWIEADRYLYHEATVLMLAALLGGWVLISAQHMLTMFIGLELMSLPLYALVAIRARAEDRASSHSAEAAMKYFVTGGLASACLLFGLSLLFGATGEMAFQPILKALMVLPNAQFHGAVVGVILILIAVAFKFGLAPFHMWVPDVYEGAPLPVTLLIATLPKIALVGLCLHLFGVTLMPLQAVWQPMMIGLGVLSMLLGNGIALWQTNIRRLLGYSSIAHMGVLILAFALANQQGWQVAVFYILTYALTSALMFGSLLQLRVTGAVCDEIQDLAGLNRVYTGLAWFILLAVFSLAGVPPMVGFIAKFSLLKGLLAAHHTLVATIMVLMACVGCFYYIRLIKVIFFDAPEDGALINCTIPLNQWLLSLNSFAVILVGVMPLILMRWI